MEGNPYMAMMQTFSKAAKQDAGPSAAFVETEVKSLKPFTVDIYGKEFSGDELLVNADLLPHKIVATIRTDAINAKMSEVSGELKGTIPACSAGPGHSSMQVSSGEIEGSFEAEKHTVEIWETGLEEGDTVLCTSADGWNTVYVLCKVVTGDYEPDFISGAAV